MAITIKQGRAFTDADRRGAAPVMIIGEATARKYWPNANPIGSRVRLGGTADSVWREIIGIAADVRHQALDKEIRPEMYLPHAQFPSTMPDTVPAAPSAMTLVIRTANEPTTMVADVRAAIRQMDPTLPVANVRTLDNVLAASVSTPRLATFLLGSFGALALVLSAIGVYGVMAYSVARRTGEIGIRIALGARTGDVLRLVVRQGMWPAVVGLALGAAAALAAARFMRGLVFGVSPTDAVSIVVSLVVLGLVALAATILPGRRGVRVDPAVALRAE
jgi:predicted permease